MVEDVPVGLDRVVEGIRRIFEEAGDTQIRGLEEGQTFRDMDR